MTPERFRRLDFRLGRSFSEGQWRLLDIWLGYIDREGVRDSDVWPMLVDTLSPQQLRLFRTWLRALDALARARLDDSSEREP